MQYRRSFAQGATYFFTVNLAERDHDLLIRHIEALRISFRKVRQTHPFEIIAMVVLPEHLHCIWQMPEHDMNYPLRWALIKANFSRQIPRGERISDSRKDKRERGIWQRRYWEHQIKDDLDLKRHVDYIHINPLKHGYVTRVRDWPYSSFHRSVKDGLMTLDWAGEIELSDQSYGE
ncbi:MAG: transposase [Candidatus Saccharibacteria bacterium]|nr:transposase [Moraxellaceae bacterium]